MAQTSLRAALLLASASMRSKNSTEPRLRLCSSSERRSKPCLALAPGGTEEERWEPSRAVTRGVPPLWAMKAWRLAVRQGSMMLGVQGHVVPQRTDGTTAA
eukprot:CAMPEP_0177221790 /NCGR_PEP_ID=MMETSP0367-20130122/37604_1 /TAXON_ID=447022 ORGANISM="Scrippsiella hangoei-like, Strain SHHI-4" /NCGR_SAMPLE_ID=MMETSP0367 /ASSEMBLY_ACC=CAM_ASM_000362 /LENGTH=100 /DNA_ID=CAMNT_0018671647 /DNA_START=225 /DNA_END=527 /DNA_ORIENTATION=-